MGALNLLQGKYEMQERGKSYDKRVYVNTTKYK